MPLGSALIGGVGGGIMGSVGAIAGGYSTAIASSVAFGCAGAAIGTGGAFIICAGVIKGVMWLNSRNNSDTILQDKLNETSEEMSTKLQLPVDLANNVIHSIIQNIQDVQAQESEQHARIDTAILQIHDHMPTLNQASIQMSKLTQPLQLAATTTEDNANALTKEVHRLHMAFEIKACALQKIEKTLSEKEMQLRDTLEALAKNQKQFAQLLSQPHNMNDAADIFNENAHQAKEIASLKTQVKQLSSKNNEFVVAMNKLLMEIDTLKVENETLKQTMQLLSLALDEKPVPQEMSSRLLYAPTMFQQKV